MASTPRSMPPASPSSNVSFILAIDRKQNTLLQYPHATGEDESRLQDLMCPDASIKEEYYTTFFLGRSIHRVSDIMGRRGTIAKLEDDCPSVEVYAYEYAEDRGEWETLGDGGLVAVLRKGCIEIIDDIDQTEIASITPHLELEFTELEDGFACVLQENGSVLGIRFKSQKDEIALLENLEKICSEVHKTKEMQEQTRSYNGTQLQCCSLVTPGCVLAVCTQHPYVGDIKKLLPSIASSFKEKPEESSLKQAFDALNSSEGSVSLGSEEFSLSLSADFPDKMDQCDINDLLTRFPDSFMSIYNGVLTEQRVLFQGTSCTPSEMCRIVLTAASLVLPQSGVTRRACFPCTKQSNYFSSTMGYIAGLYSQDPVSEDAYDLLCNLDNGSVTYGLQSFFKEDCKAYDFKVLQRLRLYSSLHSESAVRHSLEVYTRRILDLGLMKIPNASEEENVNEWRLNLWRTSNLCSEWEEKTKEEGNIIVDVRKFAYSKSLGSSDLQSLLGNLSKEPERKQEIQNALYQYGVTNSAGACLLHQNPSVRTAARGFIAKNGLSAPNSCMSQLLKNQFRKANNQQLD